MFLVFSHEVFYFAYTFYLYVPSLLCHEASSHFVLHSDGERCGSRRGTWSRFSSRSSRINPFHLESKADPRCSRSIDDVSTIADAGASGEYIVPYTAGGDGIAYFTCQRLTGRGVGLVRPDECAPLAGLIAASTIVIY